MDRHAVFLNGPIGAGKTTLGRALAQRLNGQFLDGDDYADHSKPWYCSIRQTSQAIVDNGLASLRAHPVVVIAYPLGCSSWIYYRRKFGDAGRHAIFVTLRASYEQIVDASRGRTFNDWEHRRIRTMIREGYDSRAFSDLIVDSGSGSLAETLTQLTQGIQAMIGASA